ncbi:MAG: T9SS type A sorting domain-containing protein [Bacteroidetes bacterium]|nr:T9SS type A sorting domain-containing protein [Bacteroidota bacterium]
MKQLLLLLVCILLVGYQSFAQITIVNSDMPYSGDTIRSSTSLNTQNYDFSRTGDNLVWDFTGLEAISQQVDTFLNVTQTPVLFWPFFLTSANVARKANTNGIIPGLPVESAFQYFNRTSSAFSDVGTGLVFNGIPVPLKYDAPDVLYRFPMTTSFQDTVNALLELSITDLGYIMVDRNRISEVDGWGVLKSPYGEFEVLRLKSTVDEYDSLYLDSLGMGFPIQRNYIEYKWIGKEFGLPLMTVTVDEFLGEAIIYLDSVRDVNVSVPDIQSSTVAKIFPNPAQSYINVTIPAGINSPLRYAITDIGGKLMREGRLSPADAVQDRIVTIQLPQNQFNDGAYVIRLQSSSGTLVSKFTLIH